MYSEKIILNMLNAIVTVREETFRPKKVIFAQKKKNYEQSSFSQNTWTVVSF